MSSEPYPDRKDTGETIMSKINTSWGEKFQPLNIIAVFSTDIPKKQPPTQPLLNDFPCKAIYETAYFDIF